MFALAHKKEQAVSLSLARCLGGMMLAHFAFIVMWKLQHDRLGEMLSLSNFALLVAAVGLIKRSALLVSSALVAVAVFHAAWLIDFAGLAVLGQSPLGLSSRLIDAPRGTWIAHGHYFYMVPLLAACVVRRRWAHGGGLIVAAALFAALSISARLLTAGESNINAAFAIDLHARHELFTAVNALPMAQYLAALNVFVAVFVFAPIAVVVGSFRPKIKSPR